MTHRQQLLWWGGGLVFLLLGLYYLSPILLPFVAGSAVAYFLDPLVDRLQRLRVPRGAASALVLTVFFLLVIFTALLTLPILQQQIAGLARDMPAHLAQLREHVLPHIEQLLGRFGFNRPEEQLREALGGIGDNAMGFAGTVLKEVWSGGLAIVNLLSLLFVTPIVAFYLLRDWDDIVERVDGWLPRQHRPTVHLLLRDIDRTLARFVRGQGTVCVILGVFYATALTLAGLELGLVIGTIAGLISFVPFVGTAVGALLSMLQALTQFWPDFLRIGLIAAIFIVGQVVEGNFLTPRLLGDRVGLHPVWVLFGLLAGGALFGFVGVLLAVPVAAAIGVLVRFALQRYQESPLYLGSEPGAEEAPVSDDEPMLPTLDEPPPP